MGAWVFATTIPYKANRGAAPHQRLGGVGRLERESPAEAECNEVRFARPRENGGEVRNSLATSFVGRVKFPSPIGPPSALAVAHVRQQIKYARPLIVLWRDEIQRRNARADGRDYATFDSSRA